MADQCSPRRISWASRTRLLLDQCLMNRLICLVIDAECAFLRGWSDYCCTSPHVLSISEELSIMAAPITDMIRRNPFQMWLRSIRRDTLPSWMANPYRISTPCPQRRPSAAYPSQEARRDRTCSPHRMAVFSLSRLSSRIGHYHEAPSVAIEARDILSACWSCNLAMLQSHLPAEDRSRARAMIFAQRLEQPAI